MTGRSSAALIKANKAMLAGVPKKQLQKFKAKAERVVESLWIDGSGHIVKAITQSFGATTTLMMSNYGGAGVDHRPAVGPGDRGPLAR